MSNLFLLNEITTNGMDFNLLNIISFVSILCGILVIVSKNPIVCVLFLIGLFITIAGYLMMLGINFIGLSYLLVYVGAVSILFLFILMLINVRVSELVTENRNSAPLAVIVTAIASISQFSPDAMSLPAKMVENARADYLHNASSSYSEISNFNNLSMGISNC